MIPSRQTLHLVTAAWASGQTGLLVCATGAPEIALADGQPVSEEHLARVPLLLSRPVVRVIPQVEPAVTKTEMGPTLLAAAWSLVTEGPEADRVLGVAVTGRYFAVAVDRLGLEPDVLALVRLLGTRQVPVERLLLEIPPGTRGRARQAVRALRELRLIGLRDAPAVPGRPPVRRPRRARPTPPAGDQQQTLRRLEQDWRALEKSTPEQIVGVGGHGAAGARRHLARYRALAEDLAQPAEARVLAERCRDRLAEVLSQGAPPARRGTTPASSALARARRFLADGEFAKARSWAENALQADPTHLGAMALFGAAQALDPTASGAVRERGLQRLHHVCGLPSAPADAHLALVRCLAQRGQLVDAMARLARAREAGADPLEADALAAAVRSQARDAAPDGDRTDSAILRFRGGEG